MSTTDRYPSRPMDAAVTIHYLNPTNERMRSHVALDKIECRAAGVVLFVGSQTGLFVPWNRVLMIEGMYTAVDAALSR